MDQILYEQILPAFHAGHQMQQHLVNQNNQIVLIELLYKEAT